MKLRGLDPAVRAAAQWTLDVAQYYGVPVTVTSGYRSLAQQRTLRAQHEQCVREGRYPGPPPCAWPANRPGDSAHNFGWAWDSVVPSRYQSWWNELRRYAGFRVPDHDAIHAEVPNWRQYRDA